jgi:hypothetical protein
MLINSDFYVITAFYDMNRSNGRQTTSAKLPIMFLNPGKQNNGHE